MNAITRSGGFEPVHAVASLLSDLAVPWWITGGWAIDLAAGHVTRDHADVNVMMLERDEYALRGLTGVDIQLVADGQPPGPWPAGRRLTAGPGPGPKRPGAGPNRLVLRGEDLPLPAEVILASAVRGAWVYQDGPRIFTRPLADITRYREGIPFLGPEVVLLIKGRPGLDKAGHGHRPARLRGRPADAQRGAALMAQRRPRTTIVASRGDRATTTAGAPAPVDN